MAYRYTVLFELAWTDFETAHYLFHSRTHPPLNQICFMSHQAVEKWLKGVLESESQRPDETHNLVYINNACKQLNARFVEIDQACSELNPYAVTPRYSSRMQLTDTDAYEAVQNAQKVYSLAMELGYLVEIPGRSLGPSKPEIWLMSRQELLYQQYIEGDITIKAVEKGLKSLVNPTELQMLLSSWREERQQKLREGKR